MKKISWFSCGCSSFLATWLVRDTVDEIIYTHVANQHPDSLRFLHDCEKLLGREITILKSDQYADIYDVFLSSGFINSPHGAPCTDLLKKAVRKKWETLHNCYDGSTTYVWGFDCTERNRAERLLNAMQLQKHEFPLIDNNLDKFDVHGYCEKLGLKRPIMYDLGYDNNNCVGCVKGGMGYWNKIRIDFPEVFEKMAKLEREIGASCINGVFLDELTPDRGRTPNVILPTCDIFCELAVGNSIV